MKCNREEAVRARRIALNKLEKRDFSGAQRVALQAQRLCPELENLSQLLSVCKVYCAAEAKINRQLDWYGILQVHVKADDTVIRKQYDELAFWLHPNKNTLPGAETAFKLVSEAHMILSDHVKRSRYDIKRQTTGLSDTTLGKRSGARHIQPYDCAIVFWTVCPHCQKRFVYYQRNFLVICDDCGKTFFAFKLSEQAVPSRFLSVAPDNSQISLKMVSCQQGSVPDQLIQHAEVCSTGGSMDSEPTVDFTCTEEHITWVGNSGVHGEGSSETRSNILQCSVGNQSHTSSACADKGATGSMMLESPPSDVVANHGREDTSSVPNVVGSCHLQILGKRKHDDCTDRDQMRDSCINKRESKDNSLLDADSTADKMCSAAAAITNNYAGKHVPDNMDRQGEGNATHEGSQQKYMEEVTGIHKQVIGNPGIAYECTGRIVSSGDIMFNDNIAGIDSPSAEHGLSMPVNPKIFDFEKLRDVSRFAVGQIWAIYDNLDGMPRFYARILQLDASDFKVHLAWLEHEAVNKKEEKWTDEELPVACGKFCLRKTRHISPDRSMFSHIVPWMEGKERNSYVIYPIKGEVWALYKGWSMEWSLDADNHRSYEFVVVEVLSNTSADSGATVIPLVRIKGFASLFATARDKSSFTIPSSELLQFSHRIPFYRTTGNEKVGVPGGFLELDTAALPTDLNAAFPSVTLEYYMSPGSMLADFCSEQGISLQKCSHGGIEFGDGSFQSQHNFLSPITFTYPESAFHNFEELRTCAKFERGQIWALYSVVDKFPKFYGWVNEVEKDPFRVSLTWLEACPKEEQEEQWLEQGLTTSCGTFRVRNWTAMYDTNEVFSHVVNVRKTRKESQFEIRPQVGEVWAIYLNWSPDWAPSSSEEHTEYAIGKISRCTKSNTMFEFLTKVDGYVAVFKHDDQKGALKIPVEENLRFSHQIPSFRLTEEDGGELRGFYELDPAAVPDMFLSE